MIENAIVRAFIAVASIANLTTGAAYITTANSSQTLTAGIILFVLGAFSTAYLAVTDCKKGG